ncbi:hypothetical protein CNYM01_09167 [Colletotrichum nymphaeae SA-01]|uniref:Uncharacterized protein n=1 Tax=Colletotrichum nymphaeae SA-01 TaxID=1460502 RepID=A0A135RVG2_9PEZI|nr:hypothetical protein CNYM01_09167 [Colletotrichum nymphaeae SA-01]
MTDANIRDPSPLDSTPRLHLQESEPRASIAETHSEKVLDGPNAARERPWGEGILPRDIPEYQRQVKLRFSKALEAGVPLNDIRWDGDWALPWWEGIDPADLKPGEGRFLDRLSDNSKASHDSTKKSQTVPDQHIKALRELVDKKLSGDNRYHESLTKLKELAEAMDGYPVAKQDFDDAIQPVREAMDVWHEIFAKMGAKAVPIAEADLASDFGNPISPFLGLSSNSKTWVYFMAKVVRLGDWDLVDKLTSIKVYGFGEFGLLSKADLDDALLVVKKQACFQYLVWAEKLIKSYEGDESNLMDTGHRRKVDEKPPNAKFEKDEDIATEKPTPKQPIGDKSHSDDREDEDATAIDTSLWEPVRIARRHKDLSWSNFEWMSDSAYQEYLRIVAEQSKESESEPTASQSNPQTDEADDKMNIDEENWDNIGAGWIGGTVTYSGIDKVVDDEEEDDFEATWLIE